MLRRATRRPLWLGLFATLVGLPLYALSVRTIRLRWVPDLPWLAPVPLSSPVDVDLWNIASGTESVGLIRQLVYSAFALGANLGLGLSLLGATAIAAAVLVTRRELLRRVLRLVGVFVPFAVLVGLFVVDERLRSLALELVVFLTVGGAVFALAVAGLLVLDDRIRGAFRILLLGPLATATVFLSVVSAGLASPTFGRPLADLTAGIVRFLLLNLLTVGGLNRLLSDLFELDAVGLFLFWAGVNALLGWVLAAVVAYYDVRVGQRVRRLWWRLLE